MKKLTILIVLLCFTLTGCISAKAITGNGVLKTTNFEYENFDQIKVGNSFEVFLEQSDEYYVEITCDENIMEYLDISKQGDTLNVRLKQMISFRNVEAVARIGLPSLESIDGSGSSDIAMINQFILENDLEINLSGSSDFEGDFEARNLSIDASGSSDVEASIIVDDLNINLSGASSATLDGTGNNLVLDGSGASSADLENVQLNNADIDLSGASDATINATGSLSIEASGASSLEYKGSPTISSKDLSGASDIEKID